MARSLEVQEHPATARRIKAAQRIGVLLLVLLLLAAILGLFGLGGPLAQARVTQGTIEVTYPRFARHLAPTAIEVEVARAADDTVTLTVHGELADAFHAETIVPRPEQVVTAGDATAYRFAAVPGQPHRVRFDGQMETIGPVAGAMHVDDGPAIALDTFVYP